MKTKDALGERMKSQYEIRTRTFLPRRTYTILRLDGCHFHTLTRTCKRPYDEALSFCMQETTLALCEEIQGAKFAYTQSDEISVLLTDFDNIKTEAWFDGQVQKMCSVASSIATLNFNKSTNDYRQALKANHEAVGTFDCRAFTIPDYVEVENYFIWRQQDASRNSINMLGQSLYSHKELQGKNTDQVQEMCFQKGKNWNDVATIHKRGTVVHRDINGSWVVNKGIPVFTQDREFLSNKIPKIHQ